MVHDREVDLMETPGQAVDAQSAALMREFTAHVDDFLRLHPEYADRREEIFQSWVIQKIAGMQLSIVEIVRSLNAFMQRYEQGQTHPRSQPDGA
jgi:hypothetical protein